MFIDTFLNSLLNIYIQIRRTVVTRVHEAVKALALCHNVTPVVDEKAQPQTAAGQTEINEVRSDDIIYQASSPDEVQILMVLLVLEL